MADPLECVVCGTHITYPQKAPRLDAKLSSSTTFRERLNLILLEDDDGIHDQNNQERVCEICSTLLLKVEKVESQSLRAKEQLLLRWRNKQLLKQLDPVSTIEEVEIHEETVVIESSDYIIPLNNPRKRKDSTASVSSNDGTSNGKVKRGRPKKSMSTKYIEYNSTHLCSHCGVKLVEFQNHFCIYSPSCLVCGAIVGATRITSHILQTHPELEQQKCLRCRSWFWTPEDLKCHVEQVHSTVSEAAKAAETLLNLSQSGSETAAQPFVGAYSKVLEKKFLGRCLPSVPRKEVKLKYCQYCDIRVSSDVFDWHMSTMHEGLKRDSDCSESDQEEIGGGLVLSDGDGKRSIVCCGTLFDSAEKVAEHVKEWHVRKVNIKPQPMGFLQEDMLPEMAIEEEVISDSIQDNVITFVAAEDDVSGYEVYIEST